MHASAHRPNSSVRLLSPNFSFDPLPQISFSTSKSPAIVNLSAEQTRVSVELRSCLIKLDETQQQQQQPAPRLIASRQMNLLQVAKLLPAKVTLQCSR